MQLEPLKFRAIDGKKYPRYAVRAIRNRRGRTLGFGLLNVLRNRVVKCFESRAAAKEWLAKQAVKF